MPQPSITRFIVTPGAGVTTNKHASDIENTSAGILPLKDANAVSKKVARSLKKTGKETQLYQTQCRQARDVVSQMQTEIN